MVVGDGAIIRAGLDALLDVLHKFAAPTGERGSVLLMSGGLIVLGFLFLAFLFRSAIVGDLAPVANARLPAPRVVLPPTSPPLVQLELPPRPFESGREAGRAASPVVDRAFEHVAKHGADARIVQSSANWKRVRVYGCTTCASKRGRRGCEYERGLLAGAFEALTGDLAKVHEIACASRGDPHCEFEVRHAALPEVV